MKKNLDELSEKELRELHIKMWDWLSKHPNKGKQDWPEWDFVEIPFDHCFACFCARNRRQNNENPYSIDPCSVCPLKISKKCFHPASTYQKWKCTPHTDYRMRYAQKIRDAWE